MSDEAEPGPGGETAETLERLREILAARDRQAAPGTAPASGLCLEEVFYPEEPAS